jgi:hypothetical protein
MSSRELEKIRSEALSLPESERAELAYNLVSSLDARRMRTSREPGMRKFSGALPKSIPAQPI